MAIAVTPSASIIVAINLVMAVPNRSYKIPQTKPHTENEMVEVTNDLDIPAVHSSLEVVPF